MKRYRPDVGVMRANMCGEFIKHSDLPKIKAEAIREAISASRSFLTCDVDALHRYADKLEKGE